MSMYLSCFVHEGIEEISVDLFEGMDKEDKNEETVENVIKKKPKLVRKESVLGMEATAEAAEVLDFIQVRRNIGFVCVCVCVCGGS